MQIEQKGQEDQSHYRYVLYNEEMKKVDDFYNHNHIKQDVLKHIMTDEEFKEHKLEVFNASNKILNLTYNF